MRKYLPLLLTFAAVLIFIRCVNEKPLEILSSELSLERPDTQPQINRNDYGADGDFSAGYQNGNIRSDRVILSWTASADADFLCYKVYKNDVEVITIADKSTITYLDSNLVQDNYYDYKILNMNKSGLFKTDTIRIKTPLFLPPANLNFQIVDTNTVKLFWENRAESATNYRIFRKMSTEPDDMYQQIGTASDTTLIDNNVENQESYRYYIVAYNDFESTGDSFELLVYVNYVMNSPFLSDLNQISPARSVNVEWFDNATAEDGFRVFRRKIGGNFVLAGTVPTNITEFADHDTLNSLQVDSTYEYAVVAYNQTETTDTSNILSITIQDLSFAGLNEGFEGGSLGSEWNITSSNVNGRIELSDADSHSGSHMLLFDTSADNIFNFNTASLNVNLAGLNPADNCYLRFYYKTFDEEFDPASDAVWLSSDGVNRTRVYNLTTSDMNWKFVELNLRDYYGDEPYSSDYTIIWTQYDDYPYPSDGIGIDDIEIELF